MSTIYMVTDGEYSDYRIIGAFSTREKAQAFCDLCEVKPGIEEFEIDLASPSSPGLVLWTIWMGRDGAVWRADKPTYVDAETVKDTAAPWLRNWEPSIEWRNGWRTGRTFLCQTVFAKDEPHAIKIVNEYRAQLIATGAWREGKI